MKLELLDEAQPFSEELDSLVDAFRAFLRAGGTLDRHITTEAHSGRLSDVLNFYLTLNPHRRSRHFRPGAERPFRYLIHAVGDKLVSELTRKDARTYVEAQLGRGLKTGSVRRALCSLAAAMEIYLIENELEKRNPFRAVRIPSEGHDTKKRRPLSTLDLQLVQSACRTHDDDVRWLIAILADTGARLSEIAGLALDDLRPLDDIPHLIIADRPWRQVKTHCSTRKVPLVGSALWAAKRVLKASRKRQEVAFPRYTDSAFCNADSASATIVKWVRSSLRLNHTTHELRHTMADRLRAVQCPDEIRRAIGGWSIDGVAATYGDGYSLVVKQEWLQRVVMPSERCERR